MKNFFERLSWQMIFVAYLAIFFLRNLLTPNVADDLSYKFIWDGAGKGNLINGIDPNRLQPVESFADILNSQWQHYFSWGGRTVAHTLVQFFVWQDKIFFDVANVFVFAALVLLLFKVGTGLPLREMNKSYLLLILAGIYFCAPSLTITTIWLTGTCNYLWMCTLEILFLLPFALAYRNPKKSFLIPTSSFLIAFLAGWSSEPGAAVTIFVTFIFLIHFRQEKNLQPWMKIGFIFLLVGFAILMLAPGNLHRAELISDHLPPFGLQMLRANFVGGFLPVLLREAILFVPIIFYFVKAKTSPEVTKFILTFAAASILSLLVMMFAPMFPERAGFPSTIFLLVASLAALKEILPTVEKFFSRQIKIVTIFAIVWSMSLIGCLYVEYSFHNQIAERIKIVAAHKNDDLIVVPPIKLPDWSETLLGSRTWDRLTLLLGGDLKNYDSNNRNILFCRCYGLKKIVTEKMLYLPSR
ncbi:MAG: hypothetical protein IJQ85_02940 [Selenomonadaceae bacterium]|nr:hypothetical protein [Selenomonadaceae bacterium]